MCGGQSRQNSRLGSLVRNVDRSRALCHSRENGNPGSALLSSSSPYNSKTSPQRLQVASLGSAFIAAVALATASEGSSKRTVVSCNVLLHSSQIQTKRSCSSGRRVLSTTKVHEPSARRGEWGTLAGKRNSSPVFKRASSALPSFPR